MVPRCVQKEFEKLPVLQQLHKMSAFSAASRGGLSLIAPGPVIKRSKPVSRVEPDRKKWLWKGIILCLLCARGMSQTLLNMTQHGPLELHKLQRQPSLLPSRASLPCCSASFSIQKLPWAALTFKDAEVVRCIKGTGVREKNDSWNRHHFPSSHHVFPFSVVPLASFKMEMDQLSHFKI